MKNHIDYEGHAIDAVGVKAGENNIVTIYKVDGEYACLSMVEAKECIKELNK